MKCLSPRSGHRAVALVITLILLAAIVAVVAALLALSARERMAVTDAGSLKDAEVAATTALERAKAHIRWSLQNESFLGPGLVVSRSYPNTPVLDLDTIAQGLKVDPRVPVFVDTNKLGSTGPSEFRYYLDLNRNGLPETNGWLPELDATGNPVLDQAGNVVTNFFVGDPEWIGATEQPNQPHSSRNRFKFRYAYLIVPAGRGLDLNYIHNQAKWPAVQPALPGFMRHQGFGPWEINLAAGLTDLNNRIWTGYTYNPAPALGSSGLGFVDALDLLLFRCGGSVANLPSVAALFGPVGAAAFQSRTIDGYANGPLQEPPWSAADVDDPNQPWPGAGPTNHLFTPHDLFDPARVGPNFPTRLRAASSGTSSYDRYTFYRLLSQFVTDSGPEPADKIHLNYAQGLIGGVRHAATNFVDWDDPNYPELQGGVAFLTNVAYRLFRQQAAAFPFITNQALRAAFPDTVLAIEVAPTNDYGPAVHRIFQVAANIFDATRTNRFPSVFRPLFTRVNLGGVDRVFLTGFTNDNRRSTLDAYLATEGQYGIPVVIGAKKGFPNFNEYTLRTDVQVTRKLELRRADAASPPYETNQMYVLSISNLFGLEAWNSYSADYSDPITIEVRNVALVSITNRAGLNFSLPPIGLNYGPVTLPAGFWRGGEFKLPLLTNYTVLANAVYRFSSQTFDPVGVNNFSPDRGLGFPLPEMFLTISNRVWFILSDPAADAIIDLVVCYDMGTTLDVDAELLTATELVNPAGTPEDDVVAGLWDTNRIGNVLDVRVPTRGIIRQMLVALGIEPVSPTIWRSYNGAGTSEDKNLAIDRFRVFCGLTPLYYTTNPPVVSPQRLAMQTPFCPTRRLVKTATWQANDPLVHYHIGDLMLYPTNAITEAVVPPIWPIPTNLTFASLGRLNRRYAPWGGNPQLADPLNPGVNDYNLALKDPGVRSSDDWDFPSGKLANVGLLGRVHRGSPWQTIYFKPDVADPQDWRVQSADYLWYPPNAEPSLRWVRSHPTNDWALADLFTVAVGPEYARGQLSVNVGNPTNRVGGLPENLAAWSAVLSGVTVLTNAVADRDLAQWAYTNPPARAFLQPLTIEPDALNDGLVRLVEGINRYRASLSVPSGQREPLFRSLAEFLQVPELTVRSPFLNTSSALQRQMALTDSAYERIPEQILSLLKVGEPRFVIYAFGQSLKPAPNSIQFEGPYPRLCTNYQVTGEVYTRAVARVETTRQGPRVVIESFNLLPTE